MENLEKLNTGEKKKKKKTQSTQEMNFTEKPLNN